MTQTTQKEIETKWQKFWEKNKTFEPKIDNSKEKYFITVPYPYGNSAVHIGHGKTNTTTDIIARYQRLKGKNVLFPMAYHISGSPVLAVADSIARGDEKQIKITTDAISDYITDKNKQKKLIEKFKDPIEIANFFTKTIEESFKSIGLSIDWSRDFTTGDPIYNKFIEWQYKKLNDLNILIQGKYPILYSPSDKNAVGEDDIKDGDTNKVSLSEMKYIKFKLKDSNEFLVAATLRPDSIFGATNIYVKPDMKLVKLKVENDIWIVSKASQIKIEHQFSNVKFISDCSGKDFINKEAIVPIIDKTVPIYPMQYPDENHGTGIVYSSPADSPHDYIYLFELKFPGKKLNEFNEDPLNLTPITKTFDKKKNEIKYKSDIPAFDKLLKFKIFETSGNDEKLEQAKEELYKEAHFGAIMINCKEFDNTPLKNNVGANKVLEKLKELSMGGTFYETSRRAVTRAGDEVIVASLDGQWFLDYSKEETKQKALELLETLEYKPEKLKETQKGYLNWVTLRPCARKRGLGTCLPFDNEWVIEPLSDSTIYQMFYLVSSIIKKENIKPEQLTTSLFNYIMLKKGNSNTIQKETNIKKEIIEEMRNQVEYWKSFDLRYTAPPHMSNHLSFLIYHYALIFEKEYWPKNITVGGLMIKDGAKISKSKGNGIPLIRIKDLYGVDLYRLYIAIGANFDIEMDFRDNEILQLEKKFNKWKELIENASKEKVKKYEEFSDINKWLISKFYSKSKEFFKFFDDLRIREAYVPIFYEFQNDISYHERRTNEKETLKVLRFILKDYLKIMTPAIPHICEEINEKLNEKTPISLQEFNTNQDKFINPEIEEIENIIQELITLISRTKETKQITDINSIKIIQASNERFELFNKLGSLLKETKNIKEILETLVKEFEQDKKFITKFVPKTLGTGLSNYLQKEDEKKLLENTKQFLEKEFNCKIEIIETNETNKYLQTIIPARPAILLE